MLEPDGATPDKSFFASLVVKLINIGAIERRLPLFLVGVGEAGTDEGIGADLGGALKGMDAGCDAGELCVCTALARSRGLGPIVARRAAMVLCPSLAGPLPRYTGDDWYEALLFRGGLFGGKVASWKGSIEGLSTDEPLLLFMSSPMRLLGIGTAAISTGGGADDALSVNGCDVPTALVRGVKPWKLAKFQLGCISDMEPCCLASGCIVAC